MKYFSNVFKLIRLLNKRNELIVSLSIFLLINQNIYLTRALDYQINNFNEHDFNSNLAIDPNSIRSFDSDFSDLNDHEINNINLNQKSYESYKNYYHESDCYDSITGDAKKCMPEFINAAYGLKIIASNTCGLKQATEYCVQTNLHNLFLSKNSENNLNHENNEMLSKLSSRCQKCDSNDKRFSHPPEYLNDYNYQGNITWWQSESMLEGVQYPNTVNLTLNLGKSFDINYVQIKFHSPRPESFAIYKRTNDNGDWIPYQFYSASCKETYGVSNDQIIKPGKEAVALCTDEFSDIAPLTGASVVFGTLEDRPSAYNFENSPELIEWVTATDIRITLNRLNTFGDEVFNDPQVLKSYYYAISDIAVGGRCKCNGHASKCIYEQQHDFEDKLKCQCEHNTDGIDCEKCLPFYNDVPWAPATQLNAHECKPCFCNGLSNRCHFNLTLYDMSGHGGYCDDCEANTSGPHCEECKVGFYRRENENRCIDCQCNPFGSESLQCDPNGKCRCKPGVVGDKCDHCAPYHYELSILGCKPCNCNSVGSFDSPPVCDPRDGSCRCKANVEGQNCDRPKPGFFNLAYENQYGAIPCFCFGHSSTCNSSLEYFIYNITSNFNSLDDTKQAIDFKNRKIDVDIIKNELNINIFNSHEDIWFLAPSEFLGNQQNSYNQDLSFELRIQSLNEQNYVHTARPSRRDLVIESSQYNLEIYIPIYGSNGQKVINSLPTQEKQVFTFKLNQNSGWMPQLTSLDFHKLLTNISSIKIRASYVPNSRAILSKITLKSAKMYSKKSNFDENNHSQRKELQTAFFVEECKCPIGHIGQYCELCDKGYRREPINGGVFAKCVPCNCNRHSNSCDQNTGKCDCLHHTNGDNCEKCEEGYYGNPILSQKPDEFSISEIELSTMCKKCSCPNNGPCAEIFNYQLQSFEVVCLACPIGTIGNLCEQCEDGYYLAKKGFYAQCDKCLCNGNLDENAIGNCDTNSGQCLKCIYNTTGDKCEKCLPNFWGNALSTLKCHSCDCFEPGTYHEETGEIKQCNLNDGQCECKPNVKNRQCNECKDGYWNIMSSKGCEECKCNPLGSFNLSCDSLTGQCFCRPGVQGLKCDSCMPLNYGFSDEGCQKCNCDPFGTESNNLQCDDLGKCKCKENFSGLKCSLCEENRYNFTSGCLKCDDCYNLVQTQVKILRNKIKLIVDSFNTINVEVSQSVDLNDENMQLQKKLSNLKSLIDELHSNFFENRNLKSNYKDSINYLQSELKRITEAMKSTDQLFNQFNVIFKQAERVYNQANNSVSQAQIQLTFINKKNDEQVEKIDTIKQGRLDHDTNLKLQHFAKQSREASELQQHIAFNASEELKYNMLDLKKAIKDLNDTLIKYEQLEHERKTDYLNTNYDSLKLTALNLIASANEQKEILDKNFKEADNFIRKIKNFKIPNETEIDQSNQETKNLAYDINMKSSTLKKNIDDLKNRLQKFTNFDSINTIGSAQTELNNAKLKQNDINFLHTLAEKSRNQSDIAFNLANEIFNNASKILETLEQFDQLIVNGKEKILKAEKLKPSIEDNNQNSERVFKNIQANLIDLHSKLNDVKQITLKTNNILGSKNKTFERFSIKIKDIIVLINQLEEKSFHMEKNFDSYTKPKSNDALNHYSKLIDRSDSILKQAEQIKNGTQKLLDNANNAFESLNKVNKSLTDFSVSNIKRQDVLKIQQKFELISSQLDHDNQIDETILNLEKTTNYLLNTAKQYQYQVEHLRKQVENLEEINNSLERKCFANTFAKPEL